jgi:uncharacterized protein YpiB (UPF0302 family)
MFSEGDWVKDQNGRLGFVTGIYRDNQITARFIRSSNGYPIKSTSIMHTNDIKLAPLESTLEEDDLYYLIDLALKTNDKDWFKELSSKLPV